MENNTNQHVYYETIDFDRVIRVKVGGVSDQDAQYRVILIKVGRVCDQDVH